MAGSCADLKWLSGMIATADRVLVLVLDAESGLIHADQAP
jgi:hypothetical protein